MLATLTAMGLFLSYGLSYGQAEMIAAENEAYYKMMRMAEEAGFSKRRGIRDAYDGEVGRIIIDNANRIREIIFTYPTEAERLAHMKNIQQETRERYTEAELRKTYFQRLETECPAVLECGGGDECETIFNAVSYTHLTLPTIYSV